jgi:hypothetical protein
MTSNDKSPGNRKESSGTEDKKMPVTDPRWHETVPAGDVASDDESESGGEGEIPVDVAHEHSTEEVSGLFGGGRLWVDETTATVRVTLDRDYNGHKWFHHIGLEVVSNELQVGVSLDVDDAERVADELNRFVQRVRDDQSE